MAEARVWFQKASKSGNKEAKTNLAQMPNQVGPDLAVQDDDIPDPSMQEHLDHLEITRR